MKRTVFGLFILVLVALLVSCSGGGATIAGEPDSNPTEKVNISVGLAGPGGGYVFYDVDEDNGEEKNDGLSSESLGWRYIQAAKSDIENISWGPSRTDLSTETGIGKGYSNTDKIYKATTGYTNASTEVWKMTIDGGDGWFIPSKEELELMYENLYEKKLGSFTSEGTSAENYCYWSSSEYATKTGWFLGFNNGIADGATRGTGLRIRPVRYLKADGSVYIPAKEEAEPYIFYDVDVDNGEDENDGLTSETLGWRYLQAATEDIKGVCWGPSTNALSTETAVGTGYANTKKIYEADSETKSYMAVRVWGKTIDGGEGWFIPSKYELALLYSGLYSKNKGSLTKNGDYWSSSESGDRYSYSYFSDTEVYPSTEQANAAMIVRPVRYLTADKEVYIPSL